MKYKTLLYILIVLVPVFGLPGLTECRTKPDPVSMQRHIDEVKITHPAQYQEMLEDAGGVIVDCTSCHKNLKTKKLPHEYKFPRTPKRKFNIR